MAAGRTFKFTEQMHLNQGTKTPAMISFASRHLRSKSNLQICRLAYNYRLKTHRNLKLIGLVCLDMSLHCTNYKRSMSRDSGSKVKKSKSVANIAQFKVFRSLMLEA